MASLQSKTTESCANGGNRLCILLHAVACQCMHKLQWLASDCIQNYSSMVQLLFACCYMRPKQTFNLPTDEAADDVLCCRALLEADDSATEPSMPPALTLAPTPFASSSSFATTGALLSVLLGSCS